MADTTNITAEYICSILDYDPETGVFKWKHRPIDHFKDERMTKSWNTRRAGKLAGTVCKNGYIKITVDYERHYAHRLAFLIVHGAEPEGLIDHIDLNRSNNKMSNLRLATNVQSEGNKGMWSNNTSGYKGVSWDKLRKRWTAKVSVGYKTKNLGRFECPAAASLAYQIAAHKHFGKFSRPF